MSSACSSPTVNSWIRANKLFSRVPGSRMALKLRPLGVRVNEVLGLKGIELAYDLRLSSPRFTSQDFGGPVDPDDAGAEFVNGTTVSIVW